MTERCIERMFLTSAQIAWDLAGTESSLSKHTYLKAQLKVRGNHDFLGCKLVNSFGDGPTANFAGSLSWNTIAHIASNCCEVQGPRTQ